MRRTAKPGFRPTFDRLDSRIQPSAGLTSSLARGVLTIRGTDSSDVITLTVTGRGPSSALSLAGGGRYRLSRVHAISIQSGDGDDAISILDGGRAHIPASIVAGSGDDTIMGGSGVDSIRVGDGQDRITASSGSIVSFGSGRDWLNGVFQGDAAPATNPPASSTPIATSTPDPSSAPITAPTSPTTPSTPDPTSTTPATPPVTSTPTMPTTPTTTADPGAPTVAETEAEIVALTNRDRAANGLSALVVDPKLAASAWIEAAQMVAFGVMEHTIPGAKDPALSDRLADVGFTPQTYGENIAFNYFDADLVETAWMNSPGHRENILDPDYVSCGVAVAYDAAGEPYYCVDFGGSA